MSFKTPAELNRRLGQVQFLGCEADRRSFEQLAALVSGMRRDEDTFTIPDGNAAHSWRTCYSLYHQLCEREKREQLTENNSAADQRFAAINQSWGEFLRSHEMLKDMVRRDELDSTSLEYLGIIEGDLDNPMRARDPNSRDPLPRRPDWMDVAGRVSDALTEWNRMSAEEKRSIPARLRTRRLERAVVELNRRVKALEALLLQQEAA